MAIGPALVEIESTIVDSSINNLLPAIATLRTKNRRDPTPEKAFNHARILLNRPLIEGALLFTLPTA
jgi:hypothetical protein